MIQSLQLLMTFTKLSFIQKEFFVNQISFEMFDQFFSVAAIFLLIVLVVIKRSKWKFLQEKIGFTNCVTLFLIIIFLFAPLIAPFNANLQLNLSAARNLPPLTSRMLITADYMDSSNNDELNKYFELKKKLFRDVVDDNYYLSSSVDSPKNENVNYTTTAKQKYSSNKIVFLFGTDEFGRDVFSRIIYATRLSLMIGICAVLVTFVIGLILGFISGYFSSWIDIVLNRFTEMLLAFPTVFLVILFLASFGNSFLNLIFVLGIAGWMSLFKIVRGEVQSIKKKDFIITSIQIGMSKKNLLIKDFLPLLIPSIIVNLTFQFANVIIAESSLSFLGLTGNHLYPTWGGMMQEGQYYLKQAWWISFFPSLFIVTTLITVYSLGKRKQLKINPFVRE